MDGDHPIRPWLGFAAVLGLLGLVCILAFRSLLALTDSSQSVIHTQQVLGSLEGLLTTVSELESAERGYALTGQPEFILSFNAGSKALATRLARVKQLLVRNPGQLTNLVNLEPEIWRRAEQLRHVMEIRRTQGRDPAANKVAAGEGRRLAAVIRAQVEAMLHEERRLLQRQESSTFDWQRHTMVALLYGGLMATALVIWMGFAIRREIRQQASAQAALQDANATLEERINQRTADLRTSNLSLQAEIVERKRAESLLNAQKEILGMIASGKETASVLTQVASHMEGESKETMCAITLLDPDGAYLRWYAGGHVPEEFKKVLPRLEVGPNHGPCGTAVHRKELVVVSDVARDPLWASTRDLAAQFGIRAVSSIPIVSGNQVVGTIALYFATPCAPTEGELTLLRALAGLAGIAIVRGAQEQALRQAHAELERKVAERTSELRRSNQDLEQFAYVASHDLQEPLRMVAGFTQLLARRYQSGLDEKANQYIHYAVDGVERMQQLIQGLLEYSRVGRSQPIEPVSCEEAFARAITSLRHSIQRVQALVTRDSLPTVPGSLTQLTQLFQNLIGNALKFHGVEPPRIHVSAQRSEGEWLLTFQDNGIGIDPRHAERVFAIFQRLHTREEYAGTGIGLAICKRIVERHGGRIWVESQPGQGAAFRLTLPGQPDPASTPATAHNARASAGNAGEYPAPEGTPESTAPAMALTPVTAAQPPAPDPSLTP